MSSYCSSVTSARDLNPIDCRFSLIPGVKPNRRLRVLLNPIGGKGKAKQLWETEISPVLRAAACVVHVER